MRTQVWSRVCPIDELTPDRGVAALVDGEPVAVFLLTGGELCVIGNIDPFSGASVLSRGIVGSIGDVATVASPIYKQRFDLHTGRCVDAPGIAVPWHEARIVDGWIEIVTC